MQTEQGSWPVDRRTFRVEQCLGAGGFGEVYLCTMTSQGGMRSKVAVKILRDGLDPRAQAVSRLRDEARVLGHLDHPAILMAHDLVMLDGRVALVTEYVPGADLDMCLDAKMPLRCVVEVLGVVSEVLDVVWNAVDTEGEPLRLVHRDIKPANIRIGKHGQVKVLDFGIAKFASIRETKTQANQVIGTISYMAPERMEGDTNHPAGDVYALGAILYEAFAGRQIWESVTHKQQYLWSLVAEKHDAHIEAQLGSIGDETVRQLLREALAYAPDQRLGADVFSARLEALAEGMEGPTLRKWCRAHSWTGPSSAEGELVGRTITEGSTIGFSLAMMRGEEGAEPLPQPARPKTHTLALGSVVNSQSRRDTGQTCFVDQEQSASKALPPDPGWVEDWEEEPIRPRSSGALKWVGLAAVAVVGFFVCAGGTTALTLAVLPSTTAAVEQPTPPPPPNAVPTPTFEGVEPAAPSSPTPSDTPKPPKPAPSTPAPSTPAPSAPVVPGADPEDAVAAIEPIVEGEEAPSASDCGELSALEISAQLGKLTNVQRRCVIGLMKASELRMSDRNKVGRVALADADQRCRKGAGCADYEALQADFFENIDRSDPDMMFTYAAYLFKTHGGRASRLAQAELWARRALGRKNVWSGGTRTRNLRSLYKMRAKIAAELFRQNVSQSTRETARDRAVEWAELLRSLNRDAGEAMQLCAAATGEMSSCEKRVTTEIIKESITFVSIPNGAEVIIDGRSVGLTPVNHGLPHGAHAVEMVLGDARSTKKIKVGGGEASRWIWSSSEGSWRGVQ